MFAHAVIKGTNIGTTTDTSGYFKIELRNEAIIDNVLIFSSLGYDLYEYSFPKEGGNFEVYLKSNFIQLNEIEISGGRNPAWEILREIIANKEKNNPENLENYTCREYSKIRFDLNNFTDKIKKNILLRPFDYIWENTMKNEAGIQYLPVLLVEKSVDHYYRSSPKKKKDIIHGVNKSGLAGRNLLRFVEDLAFSPNIYNDYVVILDKSFPSPLNDNYKNNYHFYFRSSPSGKEEYKIGFKPKRSRGLGFTGEMLVDSVSYAIKEISLRFDIQANVNFVRSYYIKQNYEMVDGEHWMMVKSNVLGDFTVLENVSDLTGFFGRKNSTYINYQINESIDEKLFSGNEQIEYKNNYETKDSTFWEEQRLVEFEHEDEMVFSMVEKIESDPAFIKRKKIIQTVFGGYLPLNRIQLGNIYTFYSYNEIEKSRLKFGFRTDLGSEIPINFSAYGAYGTFDKKWKYGASFQYKIGKDKSKQFRIGTDYRNDITQLGRSFNNIQLDHIITSFINIDANFSKLYMEDFNFYIEKNLTTGMTGRINYFYNKSSPTQNSVFKEFDDNMNIVDVNAYQVSGIDFTLKFSYLFEDIKGSFYDKSDLSNSFRKYPDVAVKYTYANKNYFNSDFNYQKIKLSLRQQLRAQKLGYLTYNIEMGKTIGQLPYLYLDIPFGQQQIWLDEYAFNLMRFGEYVADQYVWVHLSHHFDGLVLDKIPLLNKLKWRSFIFAKGYFGSLSDKNNQTQHLFPPGTQALTAPYYEFGFGLENILKIAKIDFLWRVTDNPVFRDTYTFIVKPSFKFSF